MTHELRCFRGRGSGHKRQPQVESDNGNEEVQETALGRRDGDEGAGVCGDGPATDHEDGGHQGGSHREPQFAMAETNDSPVAFDCPPMRMVEREMLSLPDRAAETGINNAKPHCFYPDKSWTRRATLAALIGTTLEIKYLNKSRFFKEFRVQSLPYSSA
ncbi:Hypothetical predicted protein [Lecanosticta acicola]|uniref:Uncharacterized protein n=1 Tax=Lecanosticta acicola TaxID=111012 RepID=A0AAI8Z5W6_9PEZI|nr:Hypothetical predicted protein [Lecanosticta acicola]